LGQRWSPHPGRASRPVSGSAAARCPSCWHGKIVLVPLQILGIRTIKLRKMFFFDFGCGAAVKVLLLPAPVVFVASDSCWPGLPARGVVGVLQH